MRPLHEWAGQNFRYGIISEIANEYWTIKFLTKEQQLLGEFTAIVEYAKGHAELAGLAKMIE